MPDLVQALPHGDQARAGGEEVADEVAQRGRPGLGRARSATARGCRGWRGRSGSPARAATTPARSGIPSSDSARRAEPRTTSPSLANRPWPSGVICGRRGPTRRVRARWDWPGAAQRAVEGVGDEATGRGDGREQVVGVVVAEQGRDGVVVLAAEPVAARGR